MAVDSRRVGVVPRLELDELTTAGYRLACAMLRDPVAAEDAVQEAALRAWRKQSRLRPGSDPLPWFLAIVGNECRSVRRRRWSSVLKTDVPEGEVAPHDEDVLSGADLRRALLTLGWADRLIVVLYFYLDLPVERVATAAGLSPAATRARLRRAIRKLRPRLEVEEEVR